MTDIIVSDEQAQNKKYDPSTPRTGPVPHEIIQNAGVTAALVWAEIEGMEHGFGKKEGEWVHVHGGNATIAKTFGVSQKTIQIAVTTLKKMGYLESKKTVQGSTYRTVKQIHWCKNDINEEVKMTSMKEKNSPLHRSKNDINNTSPYYPLIPLTTPEENPATQSSLLREKTEAVSSVSATHFLEDLTRPENPARESSLPVEDLPPAAAAETPPKAKATIPIQSQSPTLAAGAARQTARAKLTLAEANKKLLAERTLRNSL